MDKNQNKTFPNIVTEYHIAHEHDDVNNYDADQVKILFNKYYVDYINL